MPTDIELPWTGERLVPSYVGNTALEHLHRYAFAREYAQDKDILDIACGEGYGAYLLADVARSVIGVDIAEEVVEHARRKYGDHPRLSFEIGTCSEIPLDDASVDLVVSFETLEHHGEHDQMLREVKRVLRRGARWSSRRRIDCTTPSSPRLPTPTIIRNSSRRSFDRSSNPTSPASISSSRRSVTPR